MHNWQSKCPSAKETEPVPTYQYVCTSCGEGLEAQQSFSDDPLTECPSCAGRLRKVFGAVGVVFKGSGFYRTDSRAAESKASNGSTDGKPTAAKESGPAKDAPKADAKPVAAKAGATSSSGKGSAA